MYFLDTCICIDFLHGTLPNTYRTLQHSDPRLFAIPAVVEAELLLGVEKSAQRDANRLLVESFLAPFAIVPFDHTCTQRYATVRRELERSGRLIGPNDLLIAATALAHDATLVTHNVREFKRVAGLRLVDWDERPYDARTALEHA